MLKTVVNKLNCFEKDNLVTVSNIDVVTKKPYKKTIWKNKILNDDLDQHIRDVQNALIYIKNEHDEKRKLLNKIIPYWNNDKKIISDKIWKPQILDIVKPIISKTFSDNNINHSWFSIDEKSSSTEKTIDFDISDFSLCESLDLDTPKPVLKTVIIRLFPTEEQKIMLKLFLDQFRWYYNAVVTLIYLSYGHQNIQNHKLEYDIKQYVANPKNNTTYEKEVKDLKEKEEKRKQNMWDKKFEKEFEKEKKVLEKERKKMFKKAISDKDQNRVRKYTLEKRIQTEQIIKIKIDSDIKKDFKELTPDTEIKYNNIHIRDNLLRIYKYIEIKGPARDDGSHLVFQDFEFTPDSTDVLRPPWWDKVHNRIPRGALNKVVSSLNSAVSNYKAGNNNGFKMRYKSSKDDQYCHFEDSSFPKDIMKIKSNYWYTEIKDKNNSKQKKRKHISLSDIINDNKTKKGLDIIYEKITDRYFIHYPVDVKWYPKNDKRNDCQDMFVFKGERFTSIDQGIRKFAICYDPHGKIISIGENASSKLLELYGLDDPDKWRKMKNYVKELHWKTIDYLIKNYDIILLPEFRTSEMLRGKKLGKMTKFSMQMLSFFAFKQRLKYKCALYGKKLIIVNESYTSCTCTGCGFINKKSSQEIITCKKCELVIDRDIAGSRNVGVKNITLI